MDPFAQLLIQWIGMVCHTLLEASTEWEHVGDVSPVVDVLRRDNGTEFIVTREIMMGEGNGVASVIMLTFTVGAGLDLYLYNSLPLHH